MALSTDSQGYSGESGWQGELCKEAKNSQIRKDHSGSTVPLILYGYELKNVPLYLEAFTFQLKLLEDFYSFNKIFSLFEKNILIGNT